MRALIRGRTVCLVSLLAVMSMSTRWILDPWRCRAGGVVLRLSLDSIDRPPASVGWRVLPAQSASAFAA